MPRPYRRRKPLAPRPITARQAEILAVLVAFVDKHGYGPTLRELAALIGVKTSPGVLASLRALKAKGAITFEPREARSILPVRRRGTWSLPLGSIVRPDGKIALRAASPPADAT